MEFSDFLNIFLFNTNWNAGALIRALKQTGHFQSLAEPNLIAYNNREASFLAGGEFPGADRERARAGDGRSSRNSASASISRRRSPAI